MDSVQGWMQRDVVDGLRTLARAQDEARSPRVTPAASRAWRASTRPTSSGSGPPQQLLDRILGRDGVDRQSGSQLQAGDVAQPGVDLPVPVIGAVDLLAQRRRVQDEVVGRPVERGGEPAQDLAERLGGRADGACRPRGRSRRRGGAGRSIPRTPSARRTARRRRCRRPPRPAGPGAGPRRAPAGRTGTRPRG